MARHSLAAPKLSALLKDYVAIRTGRFLFETPLGLPIAPRNILRDSLHPLLKKMRSAGFHTFRRFREAVLQMSDARNLLIDFWTGHANGEMSGRYGKRLLANIPWRQECADAIGLGFTLPANSQEAVMDKFGQVFGAEELEVVSV
jgi:hypothetical protein